MGNFSVNSLLSRPLVSSDDFRKNGHNPSLLCYYASKGVVERVGRGLYRNKKKSLGVSFQEEDLIYTVLSVPHGVVTGISALALYNMTDEIPRVHWIAVPHSTTIGKRSGVRINRTRNYGLGMTVMKIGGIKIPIYVRERVLVEAFKYLGREAAIKSLKEAYETYPLNLRKMRDYSKKLRINIEPYIVAVTTQ